MCLSNKSSEVSEVSANDRFVHFYLQAIEQNPANLDNYRQLARMLETIGEQQQATDYLYQAIHLKSDGATLDEYLNLSCQLGDILFQQARWEESAAIYQRAIQLKPDAFWPHYNLGKVLYNLEQWEKAKQILQKAAQLNRSSAWTIYYLGEIHAHQQDWHQAVDAYRRGLALQPDLPEIRNKLRNKLNYALHQLAKLKFAEGNLAWTIYYLGEIHAHQQDWHQAVDAYHRAIALQPDLPEIRDKLSYALYQLTRLSLADARQDYHLKEGREGKELTCIPAEGRRKQSADRADKLVEKPQETDPWDSNPVSIAAPLNASRFNRDLKPKYSADNRAVKPTTETSAFRARRDRDKSKDEPQNINSFHKLLLEIDCHASAYLRLRLLKRRL